MLSTVGRFIYTKYWEILCVEHCGNIYSNKILGITSCWTLWEYLFKQNTGDYFMLGTEIYLHKILRNTVCWALWKDSCTHNTEEYCMLSTVGRFIYTKYWEILYVEHCGNIYFNTILGITLRWALWEKLFTQNTGNYFILNTEKIYLHKILRNTVCWALWEDLFTQNTEEYYAEHYVKIYLHKILIILYVKHW